MKHNHWLAFIWRYKCAPCKLNQFKSRWYSQSGYDQEIEDIIQGKLFKGYARRWLLVQLGVIRNEEEWGQE